MRRLFILAALCALPAAPLPAAPPAAPSQDQMAAEGEALDPAVIAGVAKSTTLKSLMWRDVHAIPVCWEAPEARHAATRARVRQAVAEVWEAAADVHFTGWGTCQAGEEAVRITVGAREWPRALIGKLSVSRRTSMWLNFDMATAPGFEGCGERRGRCELFTAVHEFGHVLGLIHEQDRPDTPASCIAQIGTAQVTRQSSRDLVMLTAYDPESLMNYCSVRGWDPARPLALTESDRIGLVKLFGPPRPSATAAVAEPAAPNPPKPAPPAGNRPRLPVFIPD